MGRPRVPQTEQYLRFIPSRVEGLPDVVEVVVWPDRLELHSAGAWVQVRLAEIARWPRPAWLWKRLFRRGWRPRFLPIGDRDWFHAPRDRFFDFFTNPRIRVYMSDEDPETTYGDTLFRRVQDVLLSGGFHTFDLG